MVFCLCSSRSCGNNGILLEPAPPVLSTELHLEAVGKGAEGSEGSSTWPFCSASSRDALIASTSMSSSASLQARSTAIDPCSTYPSLDLSFATGSTSRASQKWAGKLVAALSPPSLDYQCCHLNACDLSKSGADMQQVQICVLYSDVARATAACLWYLLASGYFERLPCPLHHMESALLADVAHAVWDEVIKAGFMTSMQRCNRAVPLRLPACFLH